MSDAIKQDKNQDVEARTKEFSDIAVLYEHFGDNAYKAVEKYYIAIGYEAGFEILMNAAKTGKITCKNIIEDPVGSLREMLIEYFVSRQGKMPEIWNDGNTIFLKTPKCEWCPTPEARNKSGVKYKDICTVHRRAFVRGLMTSVETFVPSVSVNYYNVGSRLKKPPEDCVEAFQIIAPDVVE